MKILDATCGARSIWYQKNHPLVTYMDIRHGNFKTGGMALKNRRNWKIKPDIIADFQNTPFKDCTFDMVIFDPPFVIRKNPSDSWIKQKYGTLPKSDYATIIKAGFKELFRILKPNGVLIFKWSDVDKKVNEILKLSPYPPLLGTRTGKDNKTHWLLFIKYNQNKSLEEYNELRS